MTTDNTIEMVPIMVPLKKASELTGISYDRLRKMCLQNKIVHIRVSDGGGKTGGKFLVNYGKLLDYLNTGDQEELPGGDAYD